MVDEKSGGIREIAPQAVLEGCKRGGRFHGGVHVAQPRFALGPSDLKRQVAHPQAWMAAFLLIAPGAAEALDQEPGQVKLGAGQVRRVQGTQERIRLNALIKGFDESMERLILPNASVDFCRLVIHG